MAYLPAVKKNRVLSKSKSRCLCLRNKSQNILHIKKFQHSNDIKWKWKMLNQFYAWQTHRYITKWHIRENHYYWYPTKKSLTVFNMNAPSLVLDRSQSTQLLLGECWAIKKNKNLPMKMSKYKITNFFFGASMEILKFMEGAEQIKHTEYYLKWLKLTIKLVS